MYPFLQSVADLKLLQLLYSDSIGIMTFSDKTAQNYTSKYNRRYKIT